MVEFRACVRLFLFAVIVIVICLTQPFVMLFTKGRAAYWLPYFWHKAACWIFGIRVLVRGEPPGSSLKSGDGLSQSVYLSNHLSYLDIPLLGSLIRGSFVAKQEVEGWALFGFLSTLQQTIFISRKRSSARAGQSALADMLDAGRDLLIFPEGTSTDGRDVRDFKSSLFSIFMTPDAQGMALRPVTVQVLEADGVPVSGHSEQAVLDIYAWHVDMDMDLGAHLWGFAKRGGAVVQVTFHSALFPGDFKSRKGLAHAACDAVRSGLV